MEPRCELPGTGAILTVTFTGSVPETQTYPDLLLACDEDTGVMGCYFIEPVNKLPLLSPWLALIGFVGCIWTAVEVARKRRP